LKLLVQQCSGIQITRGIIATRGGTNVGLQIGSSAASINNQRLTLDQSPIVMRGSTLVPLRFVSEALGAQVGWNSAQRLVSVYESGSQVASARSISVPQGAVVPVTMDQTVTSETARVGQTFTATVVSEDLGDSEFPPGTKIQGVVTQVSARTDDNPGILELDFRNAILPNGDRYPLNAALTSLDNDSVTTTRGRVMAKSSSRDNGNRTKAVAIGGAAGFLIGKLVKRNSIVTAVWAPPEATCMIARRIKIAQRMPLSTGATESVCVSTAPYPMPTPTIIPHAPASSRPPTDVD
jgi:hypothetical protein